MSEYIVTKEITTQRFSLIAGQTLPNHLAHPDTVRQLRATYGNDAIQNTRLVASATVPEKEKGRPGRKAKEVA